ncbi:RNA polymerase sigma-70 factor (ECF subfamily) [Alteromonadaceae bacterium 2753L.S.0a.02]|nr:RNA polymerase sigma-70 factor (ECF subfamily) [Alteromonadaceae bacterium 2753L.S.0a.02]
MSASAQTRLALNEFFIAVQNKALRQAEIAVGEREEALDIVQHAMMKLASKYSDKSTEWPQLFQRILQNAIRDWYRRQAVKRVLFWQNNEANTNDDETPGHEQFACPNPLGSPERNTLNEQRLAKIERALQQLPPRQQQVFMLRAWWGHNVEETAYAMACSSGSVKTHYSRALQKLQGLLEELQ